MNELWLVGWNYPAFCLDVSTVGGMGKNSGIMIVRLFTCKCSGIKYMKVSYVKYRNPKFVDHSYLWWIIYWVLYWLIFTGSLGMLFWGTGRGSYLQKTDLILAGTWLIAGAMGGILFNKTSTWKRQSSLLFWIIYWLIVAVGVGIIYKIVGYSTDGFLLPWWIALGVWGGTLGQIISESINETDGPTYLGVFRTTLGLFWFLFFALMYRVLGIAALVGIVLFIGKILLGDIWGALIWLGICFLSLIIFKGMGKFILPS